MAAGGGQAIGIGLNFLEQLLALGLQFRRGLRAERTIVAQQA